MRLPKRILGVAIWVCCAGLASAQDGPRQLLPPIAVAAPNPAPEAPTPKSAPATVKAAPVPLVAPVATAPAPATVTRAVSAPAPAEPPRFLDNIAAAINGIAEPAPLQPEAATPVRELTEPPRFLDTIAASLGGHASADAAPRRAQPTPPPPRSDSQPPARSECARATRTRWPHPPANPCPRRRAPAQQGAHQ
jgi:hypothetical protein